MFQWDKSIRSLDLAVEQIVHLFRSMRDVQLALPGLPAQEASAYLCQYQTPGGIGTTVVFYLHKSSQLAFYDNTPKVVAAAKADAMLDQATVFVESMGFLMTDLDIQLLGESDREMLWSSLPLRHGLESGDKDGGVTSPPMPTATAASITGGQRLTTGIDAGLLDAAGESKFLVGKKSAAEPATVGALAGQVSQIIEENVSDSQGNVDDLLAAVEALRTRRPGIRSRKKAPTAEELKRRRRELLENVGRILASQ